MNGETLGYRKGDGSPQRHREHREDTERAVSEFSVSRSSFMLLLSSFEDERHGPVVLERHDHHFSEASGLHRDPGRAELAHEELEQLARALRLLGVVEARTPAAGDGAGEGELRHREDLAV